jgi:hypothetical protein
MGVAVTHYLGIGDDNRLHWWQHDGREEMARVCDGVTAVNVEMFARDLHGGREMCQQCKEGKR